MPSLTMTWLFSGPRTTGDCLHIWAPAGTTSSSRQTVPHRDHSTYINIQLIILSRYISLSSHKDLSSLQNGTHIYTVNAPGQTNPRLDPRKATDTPLN